MGVVAHWRALVRLSEQQDASDDALGHPLAHWFHFTWLENTRQVDRQVTEGSST